MVWKRAKGKGERGKGKGEGLYLLGEGWVDGCGFDGGWVVTRRSCGCDAGVGVGGGADGCSFEGVDELGYVLFPAEADLAITCGACQKGFVLVMG